MKAVILAAGTASRLRPLTNDTPKCLLKIGGRCLLQRSMDALIANGIRQFVIVTGYLRGKITKGQEIQVLSGLDDLNTVTVNVIRNDNREIVDEAYNEKVELELSKGDFKDPESPDEEKE